MTPEEALNSTDVEALKEYYISHASAQLPSAYLEALMPVLIVISVIGIACIVLYIIALWNIFAKSGEKRWKAFIPVYNYYVVAKICNRIKSFWLSVISFVLVYVFSVLATYFSDDLVGLLAGFAQLGCQVVFIVFSIFLLNGLSHAFGHGKGFTVGLFFLNIIFLCIIGLGNSKYTPKAVFLDKDKS